MWLFIQTNTYKCNIYSTLSKLFYVLCMLKGSNFGKRSCLERTISCSKAIVHFWDEYCFASKQIGGLFCIIVVSFALLPINMY